MINTSNEYKQVVNGDDRKFYAGSEIKLIDGTILILDNDKVKSLKIEDAVSQPNKFTLGSAIINKLTMQINNTDDTFSDYDFTEAIIRPSIGLQLSETVETLPKGVYTSDDPKTIGSIITLTALDNMVKFDRPFSDISATFPITTGMLLNFVCLHCGVALATQTFKNSDYIIQSRPDDEAISCREVVSWIAQIAGCFARCNTAGALEIKWYDFEVFEEANLDGGCFDEDTPYSSGDSADGGNFTDYSSGDSFDGGNFEDLKRYHHLYTHYSNPIVSIDDVVITGIKVTDKSETPNAVLYGQEGYIIPIEGNPFIQSQSDAEFIANSIGAKIVGMRFRPLTATIKSDPSIEAGDVAYVSTRKGIVYQTLITSTTYGVHQSQKINCDAESPLRNSSTRYDIEAKAIIGSRKEVDRKLTSYDLMVKQLNDLVAHSFGVYKSEEALPDGSVVYYMHDKPTKAESLKIWKQTADAFAVSTDGGKTYHAGFDINGNAVVNVLSAIGVNAEWITAGKLYSKDGATLIDLDYGVANSDNFSVSDNVANGFPLKIPFNIDESVSKINKVLLKYTQDKFRTYSTNASSGGGTNQTSSTDESLIVVSQLTGNFSTDSTEVYGGAGSGTATSDGAYTGTTSGAGGTGTHAHNFSVPNHMHIVNTPSHSHGYHSHYFNVNHAHGVTVQGHSHTVNIPSHTHNLNFGIQETPITDYTIEVYVDNILRTTIANNSANTQGIVDLTAWITTPGWHTIEMRSATLKKISAQVNIKSYIRS